MVKTKYSVNVRGGYTAQSFANYRLPASIVAAIVDAANLSLAKTTWSSYRTAENHIKRCEADLGIKISFPMEPWMIIGYVGWLIRFRGVSAASISQYLTALRVVHLKFGVFPPNLRPDIVKTIIKGRANSEVSKKQVPRLAMTNTVMKLWRMLLVASNLSLELKRLLWCVGTWCLDGSFRIHELL